MSEEIGQTVELATYIPALIGLGGVFLGAALQAGFEYLRYKRDTKMQLELDKTRKALLKKALENMPAGTEWRSLSTLSGIIGAEPNTTTRLLIELGARGSEGGKDVWALISKKPLGHTSI